MWKGLVLLYLLLLSVFDIREKKISLFWLATGGAASLLLAVCWIAAGESTWMRVLLGMLPGLLMLGVAWLTRKVGCGDGLLLMQLGMLVGYRASVFILGISLCLSALFSAAILFGKKAGGQSRFAYIPFLAAGYLLWWMEVYS